MPRSCGLCSAPGSEAPVRSLLATAQPPAPDCWPCCAGDSPRPAASVSSGQRVCCPGRNRGRSFCSPPALPLPGLRTSFSGHEALEPLAETSARPTCWSLQCTDKERSLGHLCARKKKKRKTTSRGQGRWIRIFTQQEGKWRRCARDQCSGKGEPKVTGGRPRVGHLPRNPD